TWMQSVAMGWMVYRLTGSALLLGVTGFASQIPVLILAPLAGVAADRFSRRKILLATQALSMLQALALGSIVLSGRVEIWHILALSSFLGLVNAFDIPARQAFVAELVGKKEDLGNAIALNSSMFNSARLLGPSIAGVLISAVGEGTCFMLNGLSYAAVLSALYAMDPVQAKDPAPEARLAERFKEGLRYTLGFSPIKFVILLVALTSLTAMPYVVLMPAFVKEVLRGGPETLGFLMACSGAGALAAALSLASRSDPAGLENMLPVSGCVFGVGIIGLSFSGGFLSAALCIAVASFGMITQMASANTVIQTLVDDDKRGRVMAFYAFAFMGLAPFGSLLAGWAASRLGPAHAITISGALAIAGALAFGHV
ncbi:MAG TPA: MFS transporter, partial [Elusimicrobiales bacterium]|nr:MFS transporter [Elusimicrobiales bacterium]